MFFVNLMKETLSFSRQKYIGTPTCNFGPGENFFVLTEYIGFQSIHPSEDEIHNMASLKKMNTVKSVFSFSL